METTNMLRPIYAGFLSLYIFLQHNGGVQAIEHVFMDKHCNREVSMIYSDKHQGKLVFSTQPSYPKLYNDGVTVDCETVIKAWFTFPRMMFYFIYLNLNCDDGYLTFYDGAVPGISRVDSTHKSTPIAGINETLCGKHFPSDVFTLGRYLRIKYTAHRPTREDNVLMLIYTDYKDMNEADCPGYDVECSNDRCIANDAACNGFNSCGDHSSCNLNTTEIVGICLSIAAFFGLVWLAYCCRHCPEEEIELYTDDPNHPDNIAAREAAAKEKAEQNILAVVDSGDKQTPADQDQQQTEFGAPVQGPGVTLGVDTPPSYTAIYTTVEEKPALQKSESLPVPPTQK